MIVMCVLLFVLDVSMMIECECDGNVGERGVEGDAVIAEHQYVGGTLCVCIV